MTKHTTSELDGALLDAAVAKAEGATDASIENWGDGPPCCVTELRAFERVPFRPSSKWDDGGPIIERERICIGYSDQKGHARGQWTAFCADGDGDIYSDFDSPLVAAMRAYVASKFGAEVELP